MGGLGRVRWHSRCGMCGRWRPRKRGPQRPSRWCPPAPLLASCTTGSLKAAQPAGGGDLWGGKDQHGRPGGDRIKRTVGGVTVRSPEWNQSRPFLTGAGRGREAAAQAQPWPVQQRQGRGRKPDAVAHAGLHLLQPELLDQEARGLRDAADLAAIPTEAAEQLLVDDVLSALSGLDGTYVRCKLGPSHAGQGGSSGQPAGAAKAAASGRAQLAWHVAVPLDPCLHEQVGLHAPSSSGRRSRAITCCWPCAGQRRARQPEPGGCIDKVE